MIRSLHSIRSMYVCMYVCMHACMYVCVCMCIYVCVCVCMCVYVCVCVSVCMYVCACVWVCVCLCMLVYACVCVYVCITCGNPREIEEYFQAGKSDDFPSFPGVRIFSGKCHPWVSDHIWRQKVHVDAILGGLGRSSGPFIDNCNNETTNSHKRISSG